MAKTPFAFSDRLVPVQFFEGADAVSTTLRIGNDTDKAIIDGSKLLVEADQLTDTEKRTAKYREALNLLLGEKTADAILANAAEVDCFAIASVWRYTVGVYGEEKAKKLAASAR